MPHYEHTYPSVSDSEDQMLDEVMVILETNRITDELRNHILLAVSEAFTNALVHGNRRDPHKEIKLILHINENDLSADIIDQGQDGLERIENRQPASVLSEGGRGVDIMQHYAADLRFTETPDSGLKVTLKFELTETKENISHHT
ncbi:MAG: ATP-binding protein [bacterium]